MILLGGLNPVAAAEEAGIAADNLAMSTVMEYQELVKFQEAVNDYRDLVRFWEVSRRSKSEIANLNIREILVIQI